LELWFEERVKVLASEIRYVKSVDGYLVKLSSLAYDIEEYCYGDVDRARELFEKALRHPLVMSELKTLSCYKDVVEANIQRDPRVKKLREYSSVLFKVLSEIPCREGKPLSVSREATFRVEKAEEAAREGVKVVKTERRVEPQRVLFIAGLALLALAALLLVFAWVS